VTLEYSLNIETSRKPVELLKFLNEKCNFKQISEEVVEKQGVIAGAALKPKMSQAIFQKAYGFPPDVDVWFELDKTKNLNTEYQTILQAVAALLSSFQGNAVLLFNNEITVLWRLNGQMAIDDEWHTGADVEELSLYKSFSLPSPLK